MSSPPTPKCHACRECVVTEKIDGTNASVWIDDSYSIPWRANPEKASVVASVPHNDPIPSCWIIRAGSRNRFITPGKTTDNYGFAAWVRDNAEELVKLGPGVHHGEWWGQGIKRGYGLDEKRFSLFNVGRWDVSGSDGVPGNRYAPSCCHVVPVLWRGDFRTPHIFMTLDNLAISGSNAAPGFMNPEGIMIYHTAARQMFKKTFKDDEKGKGE